MGKDVARTLLFALRTWNMGASTNKRVRAASLTGTADQS